MQSLGSGLRTLLILGLTAIPAAAQQEVVDADAAGRPATDATGYYKASDMIGMPVHGADNQELGKVSDLLVDGTTNQIDYLILDTASVVDLGGQLPIVPWTIVHTTYVDNSIIVNVPVTIDRIRTAPMVTIANLDLRGTPAWRTQVNEFYAADVKERRTARPDLDRDRNDNDRPNRDADRNQPDRPRAGQRPRGENTPDAGNRPEPGNRPEAGNKPNSSTKPESRTTNKPAPEADAKPKADAPPKPKADATPKPESKPNPDKKPATP